MSPVALGLDGAIVIWGEDYADGMVSNKPYGHGFHTDFEPACMVLPCALTAALPRGDTTADGQVSETPSDAGYVQVSAGGFFSLARKPDGSIIGWGSDDFTGPASGIPSGPGFTQVSAGGEHGLALRADGSIVAWGKQRRRPGERHARRYRLRPSRGGCRYHNLALKPRALYDDLLVTGDEASDLLQRAIEVTGTTTITANGSLRC